MRNHLGRTMNIYDVADIVNIGMRNDATSNNILSEFKAIVRYFHLISAMIFQDEKLLDVACNGQDLQNYSKRSDTQ